MLLGCSVPFNKTVVLDKLTVHITDNCGESHGWALGDSICAEGYMSWDGIMTDYEILGHELTHILNKKDKEIRNPE